jgi:hypothetical protein
MHERRSIRLSAADLSEVEEWWRTAIARKSTFGARRSFGTAEIVKATATRSRDKGDEDRARQAADLLDFVAGTSIDPALKAESLKAVTLH